MATNRNMKMPGVWAKDALTTIPQPPVSGIAYRNDNMTEAEANEGQKYGAIGDSAQWNQELWAATTLLKELESQGILSWSPLIDYSTGAVVIGSDDDMYYAVQASGPSTTPEDPTADNGTYWTSLSTRLGNKADVDLGNVTAPGNVRMAHAAMPSGQFELLSLPSPGGTVTAPADGWLNGIGITYVAGATLGFTNSTNGMHEGEYVPVANGGINVFLPVSKDDVITVDWTNLATLELRFIYANGSIPA